LEWLEQIKSFIRHILGANSEKRPDKRASRQLEEQSAMRQPSGGQVNVSEIPHFGETSRLLML
jgi:hypothetical protein